ncbi:MAG TPA: hypothetical protein PLJ35_03290 [Anaerolineae bacterium]|nr:hypothetical protein [Anaerolineae bacterium]HOQ97827.1 hypothetical protein [Anaerolineae bacterium]HPL28951.1 hypothetical protein [Anaerolineae bacterium]
MAVTKRLYYLDNLRVALTVLVIAHHVGQAYGPTGGYWPVQEVARAPLCAAGCCAWACRYWPGPPSCCRCAS